MKVRRLARDLSLLFFSAAGCYLISALISARLALWFTSSARPSSPVMALLLGVVAFDLAKAPALLLSARLLGGVLSWRPLPAALGLVGLTYGLELVVTALLAQLAWLFSTLAIALCRAAAAAFFVWLCTRIIARRRKKTGRPPRKR